MSKPLSSQWSGAAQNRASNAVIISLHWQQRWTDPSLDPRNIWNAIAAHAGRAFFNDTHDKVEVLHVAHSSNEYRLPRKTFASATEPPEISDSGRIHPASMPGETIFYAPHDNCMLPPYTADYENGLVPHLSGRGIDTLLFAGCNITCCIRDSINGAATASRPVNEMIDLWGASSGARAKMLFKTAAIVDMVSDNQTFFRDDVMFAHTFGTLEHLHEYGTALVRAADIAGAVKGGRLDLASIALDLPAARDAYDAAIETRIKPHPQFRTYVDAANRTIPIRRGLPAFRP